jgi:hypothetical protein
MLWISSVWAFSSNCEASMHVIHRLPSLSITRTRWGMPSFGSPCFFSATSMPKRQADGKGHSIRLSLRYVCIIHYIAVSTL